MRAENFCSSVLNDAKYADQQTETHWVMINNQCPPVPECYRLLCLKSSCKHFWRSQPASERTDESKDWLFGFKAAFQQKADSSATVEDLIMICSHGA